LNKNKERVKMQLYMANPETIANMIVTRSCKNCGLSVVTAQLGSVNPEKEGITYVNEKPIKGAPINCPARPGKKHELWS
jgi:hypothetical protein